MPAKMSNPKISSSSAHREVDYTRIACELTTRLQDKVEALLAEKLSCIENRADRRGASDASLCRIGRIEHGWQNEGSDRRGKVIFFSWLNLNLQMVLSRKQGARPTLNAVGICRIRPAIYVIRILKDE